MPPKKRPVGDDTPGAEMRATKTRRTARMPKRKTSKKSRPAMTLGPGESYSDFDSDSEDSVHSETEHPADPEEEEEVASGSKDNTGGNSEKDKVLQFDVLVRLFTHNRFQGSN